MTSRLFLGLAVVSATALGTSALLADDKPAKAPASTVPANISDLDLQDIIRSRMGGSGGGSSSPDTNDPKRYRDFNDLTHNSTKHEGLFTLHQKDEHLYAEIKQFQFDQPLYAPVMIARGMAMAGQPVDDESILVFHRAGDKVQLVRRNVRYKGPSNSPIEKAVKQNYTDSVLLALPIVALNPGGGMTVVIDLADIFFTDFAQLGLGYLDRGRTSWFKVKAFPNNLELEVQATFGGGGGGGGRMGMGGDDNGVADRRGVTMVIHYSLVKLADPFYRPRAADDRLGHFISAVKDFGSTDPESNFVRHINRWKLEKNDSRAKLSPPKKQIVWWIEDTVPIEYRPYVEAGILEWNKAFEKAGFKNALAVRWQSDRDDFDPEDVNYCTLRWITTNRVYAMSCFRANPLTGEILDGDVIFDAGWIKAWKQQYAMLTGAIPPSGMGEEPTPLAMGEVISPIMADRYGFGSFGLAKTKSKVRMRNLGEVEALPADWSPLQVRLQKRLADGRQNACLYSSGMQAEISLAALVMAEADDAKAKEAAKEKGKEKKAEPDKKEEKKDEKPTAVEAKLPEEFLGQMIKEVVMHEVGHSLGLRHNFKASAMLTADQLNDPAITQVKGQAGSVMDYNPINLAPKGKKQGDYITTTLGPYDYWVIEYAYKEFNGDEAGELKKIASRSAEPDLVFGTDEDRFMNSDPLNNTYDLGSDNCKYAEDRMQLVEGLLKDLDSKVVKDGDSWSKLRQSFRLLMSQYGNATYLATNYIGGQSVARDHKGDKGAHDPIVPVAGDKQRDALKFLVAHVLSDKAFQFSPVLLRRLGAERWSHWGTGMGDSVEISIYDRLLSLQKIPLNHCLDPEVLTRIQDQELQVDPASKPLKLEEVFRVLSDGIWTEVGKPTGGVAITPVRRNLQREYLRRLASIVLGSEGSALANAFPFLMISGGGGYPADARALARLHLKELDSRIAQSTGQKLDDTTRAHLEECRQVIGKVLNASLDAREP